MAAATSHFRGRGIWTTTPARPQIASVGFRRCTASGHDRPMDLPAPPDRPRALAGRPRHPGPSGCARAHSRHASAPSRYGPPLAARCAWGLRHLHRSLTDPPPGPCRLAPRRCRRRGHRRLRLPRLRPALHAGCVAARHPRARRQATCAGSARRVPTHPNHARGQVDRHVSRGVARASRAGHVSRHDLTPLGPRAALRSRPGRSHQHPPHRRRPRRGSMGRLRAGPASPRRPRHRMSLGSRMRAARSAVHVGRPRSASWNHALAGAPDLVPDAAWHDARVVVEVDSAEWHRLGDRVETTERRRARYAALGWTVLPISARPLREEASEVLHEIEQAVQRGRLGHDRRCEFCAAAV